MFDSIGWFVFMLLLAVTFLLVHLLGDHSYGWCAFWGFLAGYWLSRILDEA